MIYAIEAVGTRLVKLGRSKNPGGRLEFFQTSAPYPLRLIASCDWNDDIEGLLHKCFESRRQHNEWYQRDYYLNRFIAAMCACEETDETKFGKCMLILVEMLSGFHCTGESGDMRWREGLEIVKR